MTKASKRLQHRIQVKNTGYRDNILGCAGPAINLAAKVALKALDNLKSVDELKIGKVGYLNHLFKYVVSYRQNF